LPKFKEVGSILICTFKQNNKLKIILVTLWRWTCRQSSKSSSYTSFIAQCTTYYLW